MDLRVPEGREMKRAILHGLFVIIASLIVAPGSFAATITVNPGQTIASGISAAAAGDTVVVNAGSYSGGFAVNKSITVQANGAVVVQSPSPRNGTALDIACSNCSVIGFTFVDFGWAVGGPNSPTRNNVTIRNNVFRRSATVWIEGTNWVFEGNELDRPYVNGLPAGDGDWMNAWGSGHRIRRNYFHGLQLYGDIPAGGHSDVLQMFNVGGSSREVLRDLVFEENIVTDFVQGVHITNDANTSPSPISNITVRNNVFWGVDFVTTGWNGGPAHEVLFRNHIPGVRIENNLMWNGVNQTSLYSMDSLVYQGNITAGGSNAISLVAGADVVTPWGALQRGTLGNLYWGNSANWMLPTGTALLPDRITVNPQFANVNSLLGADGLPFTADDGWRVTNASVAQYGPQIAVGGTPPNAAPVANAGPDRTVTLADGQTMLTVALLGSGTDDGTIASYRWAGTPDPQDVAQPTVTLSNTTSAPVSFTFGLVVTDNLGAVSAVDTVLITVLPFPVTPPPPPPLDTLPPVVTVLGVNPLALIVGSAFNDPGATALDDRDGVVSVVSSGTVNAGVVGVYLRTYTATDAAGNAATRTRTVNVVPAAVSLDERVIALEAKVRALEARDAAFPDTSRVRNNLTGANVYAPTRKTP